MNPYQITWEGHPEATHTVFADNATQARLIAVKEMRDCGMIRKSEWPKGLKCRRRK